MDREALADRIIRDHVTYALAAGAIPVPVADLAAVAAVQLDAVRALAKIYAVEFDPSLGKGLIASIVGASAGRFAASVAKAIPGVAWLPATVANAAFAGASTYAVAQLFRGHFSREGSLQDMDADSLHPLYEELLAHGRDFLRSLRGPAARSIEETTDLLERLSRLREQGALDAEEFERLKREALSHAV